MGQATGSGCGKRIASSVGLLWSASLHFVSWLLRFLLLPVFRFCPRHHISCPPQPGAQRLGKRRWKISTGYSTPYAALATADHVCQLFDANQLRQWPRPPDNNCSGLVGWG